MNASDYLLASIGETPLIELDTLASTRTRIWAKCEFLNPTGSHKDRLYKHAIEKLESQGVLKPGMTLIDYSSGNAGASLTLVGSMKGYNTIVVRPAGLSRAKAAQIVAYGGKLILTEQRLGVQGARDEAVRLQRRLGQKSYLMYQTHSSLNPEAYGTCGEEIVRAFQEMDRLIDAFVCPIGTGGTFSGVATVIKRHFPKALLVAVEIQEAAVLRQSPSPRSQPRRHHIEGLSTGEIYPVTETELIDRVLGCSELDAIRTQRELLTRKKVLVGPSSGASLHASRLIAAELPENSNVITILWDAGWKYFAEMRLPKAIESGLATAKFL